MDLRVNPGGRLLISTQTKLLTVIGRIALAKSEALHVIQMY